VPRVYDPKPKAVRWLQTELHRLRQSKPYRRLMLWATVRIAILMGLLWLVNFLVALWSSAENPAAYAAVFLAGEGLFILLYSEIDKWRSRQ